MPLGGSSRPYQYDQEDGNGGTLYTNKLLGQWNFSLDLNISESGTEIIMRLEENYNLYLYIFPTNLYFHMLLPYTLQGSLQY